MALDTKLNLTNQKFEQVSGDTLNLSGTTFVYGEIKYPTDKSSTFTKHSIIDYTFFTGNTGVLLSKDFAGNINSIKSNIDVIGKGTITLTSGSTNIVGIGTDFLTATSGLGFNYWLSFHVTDSSNRIYRVDVASIQDNTNAQISKVYSETDIRNGYSTSSSIFTGSTGTYPYKLVTNYAKDLYAFSLGNKSYASNFGVSFGGSTVAIGSNAVSFGSFTTAIGAQSFSLGNNTIASGARALSGGIGTLNGDVDRRVRAGGNASFNFSENDTSQISGHGANASSSVIIGGLNHNIPSNSSRSVIIGGNTIKATSATTDTVFLPKVRIGLGTGGSLTTNNANTNLLTRNTATGELEITNAAVIKSNAGTGYGVSSNIKSKATGTITLTNGSASVSGNSTLFTTELTDGYFWVYDNSNWYYVLVSVSTNTSATITGLRTNKNGVLYSNNKFVGNTGTYDFYHTALSFNNANNDYTYTFGDGSITDADGVLIFGRGNTTERNNVLIGNTFAGYRGNFLVGQLYNGSLTPTFGYFNSIAIAPESGSIAWGGVSLISGSVYGGGLSVAGNSYNNGVSLLGGVAGLAHTAAYVISGGTYLELRGSLSSGDYTQHFTNGQTIKIYPLIGVGDDFVPADFGGNYPITRTINTVPTYTNTGNATTSYTRFGISVALPSNLTRAVVVNGSRGVNAVSIGRSYGKGNYSYTLQDQSAYTTSTTNFLIGANGDYGAILGGVDNSIPYSSSYNVILGGQSITARTGETKQVYLHNLNIIDTPTIGSTGDTVLVREASTGKIRSISQSSLGGGNSWPLTGSSTLQGNTQILGANYNLNLGTNASKILNFELRADDIFLNSVSGAINIGELDISSSTNLDLISGTIRYRLNSAAAKGTFFGYHQFTPTATKPGFNVGYINPNPTTPVSGDVWYNNVTHKYVGVWDTTVIDFADVNFVTGKTSAVSINTRTGTTYTLLLTDAGKMIEVTNASANSIIVPPNSGATFAIGTQILIAQYGAGQITVSPGTGVTLRSFNSNTKLSGQYSMATLIKRATNEWFLSGDLTS